MKGMKTRFNSTWLKKAFPMRAILMWTGIFGFSALFLKDDSFWDVFVFLGLIGLFVNLAIYHQEDANYAYSPDSGDGWEFSKSDDHLLLTDQPYGIVRSDD
jgi:hypothetical protein